MTQQTIFRFFSQHTNIRPFFQKVYSVEIQSVLQKMGRALTHFYHSKACLNSPLKNVVTLNHCFPKPAQINQNASHNENKPWVVLLAIALAAAMIGNDKAEAEEPSEKLSWEELETIANAFGIPLPEARNPENLEKTSRQCFYAVFQACLKGDWSFINNIPAETLSKLTNSWGESLLIAAAGEGNLAAVQGLLRRKIALQKTDYEGNSPLHIAAKNGFNELIPLLWDRYINKCNNQGKTPHHIAIEYGHPAVLKELIAKKPTSSPLQEGDLSFTLLALCVRHSQKECLNFLLAQPNYQLGEKSCTLETLLHIAIRFERLEMLKILIEKKGGAELLKEIDEEGRIPLDFAAFLGDEDAVRFLYQKSKNFEGRDDGAPVHWAVKGKQTETLKTLIYLGASLETKNADGKEPKALLKGDTSIEANQIRTILSSAKENRKNIAMSPVDWRSQPPEGIVFKGGGPRGLAYLGALRALRDGDFLDEVKKTAGTSAGAITAAIFALDPKLNHIDSLENLNLMDFLDPISGKEAMLNVMLESKDREGTWAKILTGSFEIGKGTGWNPLKIGGLFFSQLDGICEGKTLHEWIEKEVSTRTEIKNCTFGELREAIDKRGKDYLHLHVYATRLQDDPDKKIGKILHFSSEDPEWENIVIADAIRASMSIPGVYIPYTVREKTRSGTLIARSDLGPCVDGGLIKNFPIDAFDVQKPGEYYSSFNKRTLGLCLKDVVQVEKNPPKTAPVNGIMDIVKACANIYWSAEETYLEEKKENQHRIAEIPIQGVGLLDFNLKPEQKKGLIERGRWSIENDNSLFAKARVDTVRYTQSKTSNIPDKFPDFTGRQVQLRALERIFVSEAVRCPKQTVVRLIYGLGGMGKTELTRAFARNHEKDFSIIWFINSATAEQKHRSYKALAKELNLKIAEDESPEQIEVRVHACLRSHPYEKPWLLIYDNVEETLKLPEGGYVLMTSRNKKVWKDDKQCIELSEFGLEESLKILSDITHQTSPRMPELARELGFFPLALNQAAHYIRSKDCSVEEYLTALRKNPISGKISRDGHYAHSVNTVWLITLEKLKKESPLACKWLEICAHLNPDDIPQEWLMDWLEEQEGGADGWAKLANKMEITKTLLDLSLIRPKNEGYAMHRLFQQVVRRTGVSEKAFGEAVELVNSKCEKWGLDNWKLAERWVAQANSIEVSQLFQNVDKRVQADMLHVMGENLTNLGRHEEALEYLERALKIRKKMLPPDHPDVASSYNDIGLSLSDLGRYQAALEYQQKGFEIFEKILPSNHSDAATGHNSMGASLENLGRHQEALEHRQKALKIWEKTLPPNHPNVAIGYNNVGASLENLGKHQEALGYKQKALKIWEKTLPLNHPDVAMGYNNVGISLGSLGKYPEAFEHRWRALKIWEKTLPPNHPNVAIGYNNVGISLENLGRHEEALGYKQEALKIWKKRLPPYHSQVAVGHNNVGTSLEDLGRHQEALEHMKKSLEILAFQRKHPDHEHYLRNFIRILKKQPDTQLCENSKQEILALYTEKLGKDHELIKELNKTCPKGCWEWLSS